MKKTKKLGWIVKSSSDWKIPPTCQVHDRIRSKRASKPQRSKQSVRPSRTQAIISCVEEGYWRQPCALWTGTWTTTRSCVWNRVAWTTWRRWSSWSWTRTRCLNWKRRSSKPSSTSSFCECRFGEDFVFVSKQRAHSCQNGLETKFDFIVHRICWLWHVKGWPLTTLLKGPSPSFFLIVQELCESRGGRPGLSVLTSLLVSVDVKIYCTVLRHWSQLVPNMSHDIWGH